MRQEPILAQMYVVPSIDILDGTCVRLYQGDYDRSTEYAEDPVSVAREFERLGARRIHVVDLDAARGEGRDNRGTIGRIRDAVGCMIQVGGGIREPEDIEELRGIGIERLVVGTTLARDPGTVRGWADTYGRVFLAAIDARDGLVKVSGWEQESGIRDVDLARQARDVGVLGILYTSISRDGTLSGPDIESTCRVAESAGLPVILSGGVSATADLHKIAEASACGIIAAISGRAVYEGAVDLAEAFARYPWAEADQVDW